MGTKRTLPEGHYDQIAARLRQFKIQALLIIGGFEVPNFKNNSMIISNFKKNRPTNQFLLLLSTATSIPNSGFPWLLFHRQSVTMFLERISPLAPIRPLMKSQMYINIYSILKDKLSDNFFFQDLRSHPPICPRY